ncbi:MULTISPECIES: metallophosphoesterase [unclassified Corynebacterium]|uniref:metallophosphoesterase n=1 Tax=unclassified Corynebacterium TaxID=2624378 RepID=UPI0021AA8289|nr:MULTISPECIES: metallophosphoesterase [unclassified Corynebacterium]MCT1452710.1 metallophosphoesterase [Corynebacterium sp. p3-SID1145]MCT1461612.1 metallophosphoesterase [Corynebacterium sp. p3-SID1140]MDN8594609.1 metallophosphoesterase [Corynebacterium sp. P4_F2]WKK55548.1 metallophosphoesterase [Corynebacterium sp. P4-C1]WKK62958.1 metallophosphoesterase [Corynebacterium sp. P8-C1]
MSSTSRRTVLKALALGAGATLVAPVHALAQTGPGLSSSGSSALQLFGPAGGRAVGSSESGLVAGNVGFNSRGRFLVGDVQVVTVTEDSVTISWLTWDAQTDTAKAPQGFPTAGELRVWPVDNPSDTTVVSSPSDRYFHQLTATGLKPDTTYAYLATSHGTEAAATHNRAQEETRLFTTLPRLTGPLLGTIVVANDTHIGENGDGIWKNNFPPPARSLPGERPYPEVSLDAVIDTAHEVGASHLFVNGDVTSEARPREIERAKELLGRFNGKVRCTRGNHDRPHKLSDGPEYADAPAYDESHTDGWGAVFEPRQTAWVEDVRGANGGLIARVVGIDSTKLDTSGGMISPEQFEQIQGIFDEDRVTPTVVMLHHPATRQAAWSNPAGPAFVLRDRDIMRLQRMIAAQDNIKLVLTGHTHRGRKNRPDAAKNTVFLETPAAKNWPTGATQIRFFADGMAVNFRQNSSEEALRWAARTRWTVFGLSPETMLGPLDSRALVIGY